MGSIPRTSDELIIKWLKENWFKIGILTVLVLILISAVFISSSNRSANEHEATLRSIERDTCLRMAKVEYDSDFILNSEEMTNGSGARTWNSRTIRQDIEDKYKESKDFCLKLYPVR